MRFMLEVPVANPTPNEAAEILVAVRMALAEYWQRRDPPEDYVKRRYPHMSLEFRTEKLVRVTLCVEAMQRAEVNVPMDSVHSTPSEYAPWKCKHCGCEIDIQQHAEGCPDR